MGTAATDYLEEQAGNYFVGGMDTAPTAVKIGLFVGSPGEDGTGGSDVSASINGTGAVTFTFGSPTLVSGVYQISNTGIVDFGNSLADIEGTVDSFGIYVDTGAGDELIGYGALNTPLTIATSDPVSIPAGEIKISLEQYGGATTQQDLLDWIRGTDPSAPDLYVGLYTAAPGIGGGGTEVTTNIRAAGRVQPATGWNGPDQDGATFVLSNDGKIDFGTSDNTLASPLTHFGIFDSDSGGNLLFWGALAETVPVNAGNNVFFEDQELKLRVA
jgi:hypothetical protein